MTGSTIAKQCSIEKQDETKRQQTCYTRQNLSLYTLFANPNPPPRPSKTMHNLLFQIL